MSRLILFVLISLVIIWQWSRLEFYLFDYPEIDTDVVQINGEPWRKYINSTHFTVGKGNLASDKVEPEVKKIKRDLIGLYELKQEGLDKHGTDNISALIVLEAISRTYEKSSFQVKPVF